MKGRTFKYFNRIRTRVPNLGTDSRDKGIHFIGSRELNIKRVARDRSYSVVMNLTCFNKLIEYTNCCCLSVDIIQKMVYILQGRGKQDVDVLCASTALSS